MNYQFGFAKGSSLKCWHTEGCVHAARPRLGAACELDKLVTMQFPRGMFSRVTVINRVQGWQVMNGRVQQPDKGMLGGKIPGSRTALITLIWAVILLASLPSTGEAGEMPWIAVSPDKQEFVTQPVRAGLSPGVLITIATSPAACSKTIGTMSGQPSSVISAR